MEYKITNKISKEVIDELLKVKEEKGLTAEEVVKQAKKKKSKLHSFFEWDNDKASDKWRLQQARVLINEVKIIIEDKEYYAFENVSVKVESDQIHEGTNVNEINKREYFTNKEIISNEELREQIVQRAYNYLLYWKKQFSFYREFEPVFKSMKKVEKSINKKTIKVVN